MNTRDTFPLGFLAIPSVEECVRQTPALGDRPDVVLALLVGEVLRRRAAGEVPDFDEYRGRFPAHADALRQALFPDPPRTEPEPTLADLSPETISLPGRPAVPAAGGPAPPPTTCLPIIPGYEVLEELGRGGMGVVYKARQAGLNRVVALKMIRDGAYAGPGERARFRTEAEAVARLQHPGVVQIFDVGEHGGTPYFSLEFCPGGSLAERVGAPMPPRDAAALVERLADAVQAAHAAGVVHRDLKPANVLLTADGTPKITDFGLAKRLDEVGQSATGDVMGTAGYMAPEQAAGKVKEVGPPADVYALGAILYECLTGRPPFKGVTLMDTLMQVLEDDPVRPRALEPRVPADLETVCLACLRKEPSRRYGSARALADDLRRFLDGEPVAARPVGAAERLWRWCLRNPRVAALAASLLVLLVGTLVSVTALYLRAERERHLAVESESRAEGARAHAESERIRAEASAAEAARQHEAARTQQARAESEAEKARGVNDFLTGMFEASDPLGLSAVTMSFAPLGGPEVSARAVVDRAAAQLARDTRTPPEVRAGMLDTVGTVYRSLGRYEEAGKHLRAALELRRSTPGIPPLDVATSLHNLGWLEGDAGNFPEGMKLLHSALELRLRHGADDLTVSSTQMTLGLFLGMTHDWSEAEKLLQGAVERRRRVLGDEHLQVAAARLALAACYIDEGRWLPALSETGRAVTIIRAKAGDQNVGTAIALFQSGVMKCLALGDPAGGEKDLRECLRLCKLAFGERHIYNAIPLYQLGHALELQGRADDAEKTYEDCLALVRERGVTANPRAVMLFQGLARLREKRGDRAGAVKLLDEAIEARRRRYGKDSPLLADALVITSRERERMGDGAGCEAALREAVRIYQLADRPTMLYGLALNNLGVRLDRGTTRPRAEALLRRSLAVKRDLTGVGPGETATTLSNLIDCVMNQEQFGPDVEALLAELEQTVGKLSGAEQRRRLADFLLQRCRYHRAHGRPVEAAADAIRSRTEAGRDPDRLYDAAAALALCVGVVDRAVLPAEERAGLRQKYADEAMQTLRQAIDRGYSNREVLQTDADLRPLRDRADFRELLAALDRKTSR